MPLHKLVAVAPGDAGNPLLECGQPPEPRAPIRPTAKDPMYIEIDLTTVPPTTTLREPDDFTRFKVVVTPAADAFVTPDALRALPGARPDDPAWEEQLSGMLGYAASKGWIRDEDGAIQAHVETAG